MLCTVTLTGYNRDTLATRGACLHGLREALDSLPVARLYNAIGGTV